MKKQFLNIATIDDLHPGRKLFSIGQGCNSCEVLAIEYGKVQLQVLSVAGRKPGERFQVDIDYVPEWLWCTS